MSYYRDYDLTPDGARLIMVFPAESDKSSEATLQVTVVLNWHQELLERVPVN